MKYPINAPAFNHAKQRHIGAAVLAYLDGAHEDEDINGADLVDAVMRAIDEAFSLGMGEK